jgi:hypothetical protein
VNVPGDNGEGRRPWRMSDRRQIAIHRGLRLFGDAPADHFQDACRLMGERNLRATTHLVGVSLRELESGVRGVLASMLDPEQQGAIATEDGMSHREQIRHMCDLLGFDPDDPIRDDWWTFASRLSRYTHRSSLHAPRPVDNDFLDWWTLAQAVLAAIVRQFETIYAEALPQLEELAAKDVPVAADLRTLRRSVPHGDVALARFFELATPAWFPLLREAGYFRTPPPLEPDEEGRIAYVPWPPGTYLVRLAADEQYRAEVVELARALGATDNPAAGEAIVEIALAVPVEDGVVLAEQVSGFLASPFQWRLPFKARDLVVHFAAGGQIAAGLALFRTLVSPGTAAGDGWRTTSMLEELVPQLFPSAGRDGLELLADLLDQQLEEDSRTRDRDYSYMWRPAIESGRRHDFRDALVTALRDAAARVVEGDRVQLADIVALLEQRPGSIFARLALDLLRRFADDQLVAARLGDRGRFDDFNLEREWTLLAQERFAALPDNVRERILGWVAAGPADAAGPAEAEAEAEAEEESVERRERWQLHQLVRLGDSLPEEWRERRDELLAHYGAPRERPVGRAVWSGETAPLTKEELAAKSVDEIVDYLNTWTPEDRLDSPSPEALAGVLGEVVAEDPARFAAAAELFLAVEPTYARHVVSGLAKAASEASEFDFPPVVAFAAAALGRPRLLEGRPRHGNARDPGWIWTRLEVARLLSAGLEKNAIPVELGDEVWALLATLAEDDEPDLDYEDEWADGGMGPLGLSLNTVRGAAMHAVMRYAWWRKEQTPADETPVLEPRLRELLDRRLDPGVEPTRTVRAVYGQWFPYLVAVDGEWAAARVDVIFPLEGEQAPLGRVAWDSYLGHNRVYDNAFALLRPQYAAAIARVAAGDDGDDEAREALVGHLISTYVRAQVTLDDNLLGRFFTDAPVELRAQLISAIGVDLSNADDIPEERLERLRAMWEARLHAATAAGGEALRELHGFSWWFGSGKFDDEWSLAQLTALFDAGGTVEFEHVVIERLNELRDSKLGAVLRVLSALIEHSEDPWFVLGSRDEIRTILRAGLDSDEEAVRQTARRARSRLIARGHPEFRDLLE